MKPLNVIVHGATGRMGQIALMALENDTQLKPVGAVGAETIGNRMPLTTKNGHIPYETSLKSLLTRCEANVVIDFTNPKACMAAANIAANNGLHLVTGTSGLVKSNLEKLELLSKANDIGIIVAPNFALGAVILAHLSQIAAQFFDYAEIFETHHENKVDAPSGTALSLAKSITNSNNFITAKTKNEYIPNIRGGNYKGVSIHSSRIPGKLAQHEIVFGSPGQTLSLRHDTINRECYIPAIVMAIKEVVKRHELIVGMEKLLIN